MYYLLFQVNHLPDLTLTKYSVFEGAGVEDVQDKHSVFLRQLHQLGHRFGVYFHLLYMYNPNSEIDKGNHLQIMLYATSDTADKLTGIKEFIETSALSIYYDFFCYGIASSIEIKQAIGTGRRYVELINLSDERVRYWISENAPSLVDKEFYTDDVKVIYENGAFLTKKDYSLPALNRLDTDNLGDVSLYSILEWEPCENGRLYNVLKLMEGYNASTAIRIDLFPKEHTQIIRQALPYAETRRRVSDHKQGKDDNSELIIKSWDNYINNMMKFPQFFVNIIAFADSSDIAIMLADSIGAEAVESGTYSIEEISDKQMDVFYNHSEILYNTNRFEKEQDNYILPFLSLYTLEEVRPMFSLPILYPGETIECKKETDPIFEDNGILLGTSDLGYDVRFPLDLFKKHAFIAGVPGAGKTNTMLYLITSLWRDSGKRIPFLVLEPAKQEYRAIARIKGMEEVSIFSPGADTKFPLHINPFEFPIGLTLAEHIANLNAVFAGAFELPPPSPHFIDTCIEKVYLDKGWNVNARNDGKREYPTLQELYTSLEVAVKESHYQGETLGNLQSVLEVRVGSLLKREIGNVYNVKRSIIKPEDWIEKPVVIELEALGEGPANFMSLLISTLIREALKVKKTSDINKENNKSKEVEHVIFYEEAHNLIGPETEDPVGGSVNPKISATKFLVKMLAEVRALGEGIVIADQLPTVMAPEVLKNTGLKIAHRITAQDDRNLLGSTMSAMPVQLEEQGNFSVGQALVFYERLQKPFKMNMCEWEKGGSKDRYESPTNNQLFEYIKDTEVYRDIIKESMLIMQEKMKAEFDVLRKNARDIAKIIACSDECKIIEAIDSIRNLDENDVICSGLKKVSRAYVNLYYAYMTLSNNYYIHKTDMYACVINNFLSLFEILDVVKNKTLNNILYEETKGVIENIRSKYVDIKNGKINGILSTHNGALRICFGMEYVVANEMQKQLFQFIQSIDELLGETNTDVNNIKSKINDLCNNIDDYFDKYQELSEQYVDIRAKLEQRILDDMKKEENVKNIDFYEELKREQLLSCEKKYFLYVELIINSMNLFDMKILSHKEISKYFYIKTERLRNQIKKYVGYTTCKESSILEDSNRYCELKELSLAPCSAEIYYGFLYIEEQVRNVNKCEQLYDLSVKCKELFAKYYFTKQMIFGKKTRYYLKTLVTLYAQILWCIRKVNNADIEKKCIKKLGISFKQVRNLVTCMNNAGQIKEDVNDIVVYFEQYLSK